MNGRVGRVAQCRMSHLGSSLPLLATLVALSMLLLLQCDVVRGINVALHGQVSPKEFVVGSAVTCEGMRTAFEKRSDVGRLRFFILLLRWSC